MSLIEALIALVVASGMVIAALEICHTGTSRNAIASMEMEAAVLAEERNETAYSSLATTSFPIEGRVGDDVAWSTTVMPLPTGRGPTKLLEFTTSVTIIRAGSTMRRNLSVLKLQRLSTHD
jgi:type II secretory pathway pseudopilin PulG